MHREHYENFREFMRNGGLRAWIQERGEALETKFDFRGGTVAVVICRRLVRWTPSSRHNLVKNKVELSPL
jgi:hypothetical protein